MQFPYERDEKQNFQEAQLTDVLKLVALIYEKPAIHKLRVEQETMLCIREWTKIHMIAYEQSLCKQAILAFKI